MIRAPEGRILLAISLALLSFLTVLAWEFNHFSWDLELLRIVQSSENSRIHVLMLALSWLGAGWVPWILSVGTGLVVLLFCDSCKRWNLVFWAGLGSGAALMGLLKVLTMRPRPSAPFAQVLVEYPGFSFPSGHVIFFVQYFGFLYLLIRSHSNNLIIRRVALILMGLPMLLVGYSRIYIGAHWPSDVLGGYLLGGVLLALMIQFSRK